MTETEPRVANPREELREALAGYAAALENNAATDEPARTAADLAEAAGRVLDWMEEAGVDPGDPPSCGCGGYHWVHPGDTRADGVGW